MIRQKVSEIDARLMFGSVCLSLLPVASFALQYEFSVNAGTQSKLFDHLIVSYVDWLFVPFNFLAVRSIDWKRGGAIFASMFAAVVCNVVAHAIWQCQLMDGGHMISPQHVVLPAGWVHLGYSIIQTAIMLAFIFVGNSESPIPKAAIALAVLYFLGNGISGYLMTNRLAATDVGMAIGGSLLVILFPRVRRGLPRQREAPQA